MRVILYDRFKDKMHLGRAGSNFFGRPNLVFRKQMVGDLVDLRSLGHFLIKFLN